MTVSFQSRPGIIALVMLLLLSGSDSIMAQGMPPSAVRVDEVRLENVQEMRRVTGNLRAVARSRVATLEEGRVISYPITEGQFVKKGEVLAKLNSRRLELELLQIESEMHVARAVLQERDAEVELEQHDLDLLQKLDERGASNPKELADAISQLKSTEARRDQAQRQLEVINVRGDLLRTRLDDTIIRAPFDGVIISRHTEVGEWISEGGTIVELLTIGVYDAWLDIPQKFANAIIGKDVKLGVSIEAINRTFEPSVPRVIRQVDPKARSFSAVVRLEDTENVLVPGMSVTGWAPTGATGEHLTIAKDALMKNPTGYHVYVVRKGRDGGLVALPATVFITFDIGQRLAVTSRQLAPGDRIVVEGNERLFPTAPVSIATSTPQKVTSR
ncbi:MAG: efflux RND transporter periplasmic adaptor subunit [Planctomycetes bacterium]|nr:efflux RND transporter periplasmic adaptor subunit [Planctomycetota bacterium]